jgi:hypothetical protein
MRNFSHCGPQARFCRRLGWTIAAFTRAANPALFAYSNEQAEPFGLSTAKIATELAKPVTEQTGVHFEHCSPDDDAALYRRWQEKKK